MASADVVLIDDLYYILNQSNKTAQVTYKPFYISSKYSGIINIPETVKYDNVTYSVTSIGDNAFSGSTAIWISIPLSVKSIGEHAFRYCEGLTSITIPESVTSIGGWAFEYCSKLESIDIGKNVSSIPSYTFYRCWSLSSIVFPDNLTHIGSFVFEDTSWYNNQPNGVIYAGNVAYGLKGDLKDITIKEGTIAIADEAFRDDSTIKVEKSINLPSSLIYIGSAAFDGCKITSIKIPENVSSIGDRAFCNCYDLNSIIVDSRNIHYDSRNDCNAVIETSSNSLIVGSNSTIIPDDITQIDCNAFEGRNIISLHVPNSVQSIGDYAFQGCTNLSSIDLPISLKTINSGVFSFCTSLSSITIPKSVINIGENAFSGCI